MASFQSGQSGSFFAVVKVGFALVRAGRLVASAMASILAVRHVMTLRGVDAKAARREELLVTAGVGPGSSPNWSSLGGRCSG